MWNSPRSCSPVSPANISIVETTFRCRLHQGGIHFAGHGGMVVTPAIVKDNGQRVSVETNRTDGARANSNHAHAPTFSHSAPRRQRATNRRLFCAPADAPRPIHFIHASLNRRKPNPEAFLRAR